MSPGGGAVEPPGVVALVESNTTGTGRLFAAAVRARGLRPVLLSVDPQRYPWLAEDGVDVTRVETGDAEAVALACGQLGRRGRLAGVLTSSEYFTVTAARAAARLGLPGPAVRAVEECRDKCRQRAALLGAGVTVPAFEAVGSVSAAVDAASDIGLPVVCKPADGTGSRGVRLCTDLAAVARHARRLLTERCDERGRPSLPWLLVERYVPGPEVSVETFGSRVTAVTVKHLGPLPDFVEVGHDFPAPAGYEAAAAVALQAVDALGLTWGPAHTEVRLTASRAVPAPGASPVGPGTPWVSPVVIEVNPRLAGGRIPDLVRLGTGVDLVGATVDVAVGAVPVFHPTQEAWPPTGAPPRSGASIRFLLAPGNGWVRAVTGLAEAARVPGVVDVGVSVAPGDRVRATGSFLDRLGYVIATGPTSGDSSAFAERALARLRVELGPGSEGERERRRAGPPVGCSPFQTSPAGS